MTMRVIGWDKDGVLADASHRQWMVPEVKAGKRTWEQYAAACLDDKPVESSIALMRILMHEYRQVVMSASTVCTEGWRWMDKHRVPYASAYFRPRGDCTESGLLKARWIRSLQDAGNEVVMFFEDVPEIAETIRQETGVKVLVVNPCYSLVPDSMPAER